MDERLPPRFWAKVDTSGDCWTWTGSLNHRGYGRFRWDGEARLAHRVAYAILVGRIPTGMQVDHSCYTKRCVNPKHLRAVTHTENQENRSGARVDSASGVRGVYYNPVRETWDAYAVSGTVKYNAGSHETLERAAAAARALRLRLHTNNMRDRAVAA